MDHAPWSDGAKHEITIENPRAARAKPRGPRLCRGRCDDHLRQFDRPRCWHFADSLRGAKLADFSGEIESTSPKEPSSVVVGRDGQDHWIVVETNGLCGGLFVDEASAMRFAREETHWRPGAVHKTCLPMIFRLGRKEDGDES